MPEHLHTKWNDCVESGIACTRIPLPILAIAIIEALSWVGAWTEAVGIGIGICTAGAPSEKQALTRNWRVMARDGSYLCWKRVGLLEGDMLVLGEFCSRLATQP